MSRHHHTHPNRPQASIGPRLVTATGLAITALALLLGGCSNMPKHGEPKASGFKAGETIGVLLPTTGQFASEAEAILDGIRAAKVQDGANGATIVPGDNSKDAPRALAALTATPKLVVIGPLLPKNINAVMLMENRPAVPMLVLNESDVPVPWAFQFPLSPDAEAKTVARWVEQLRKDADVKAPAIVYPQDTWGKRQKATFTGINPKATAIEYDPSGSLNPRVKSQLADADVIFLVARADRVADLFNSIRAAGSKAAVIATSHATDQQKYFNSLNDLFYVDVPWLVEKHYEAFPTVLPKYRAGEPGRLFAMGIDAYRLAAQIARGNRQPALPNGMTGAITLKTAASPDRLLSIGRFKSISSQQSTLVAPQPANYAALKIAVKAGRPHTLAARNSNSTAGLVQ